MIGCQRIGLGGKYRKNGGRWKKTQMEENKEN
jgi:hypothetical protein